MMKKYINILILLSVVFLIAGCNKEKDPTPEDRFAQYVKLWNEHKFDEMYDYLSTAAKETISKEDFSSRYAKIYEDLQIQHLEVKYNKPAETEETKEEQVQLPFSAKMESVAGEITFDHQAELVKEELEDKKINWFLNWNTTFIFPDLEEGDTVSLPSTAPKRGSILAKDGTPLAETGVALEIGLVPKDMKGQELEVVQKVSELLGISTDQIEKALNASWVKPEHFVPLKKIAVNDMELREQLGKIPAIQRKEVEARVYPLGEAAAHLTGNLGPVTAEDIEKSPEKGYGNADVIGRRGLEKVLEDQLRGERGVKIVIKKADGTEVILAEKAVKDGENVQLTIDPTIQKTIFAELDGKPGTAAAIDPITGETLALVSSPSFDPNTLTLGATNEQWAALQDDPNQPLLIRFNSTFAPGSVLKPITAAIGLQEGAIDWEKATDVKGLGWGKESLGYEVRRVTDPGVPVDLEKALIYSDNIYFAQAALELGKDKFIAGLKNFGFDEDIPFLYPMEQSSIGNIDSDVALANSSYGQGQVEMSVLHLASTYTPFVNKGNMIKPILQIDEEHGQVWKKNLISEEQAGKLDAALRKVVSDPSGTARGAKIEGYPLAGKTGTAEYDKEKQGEKGKENGWFVAYNAENPELLIALMLEEGSSGTAVQKVKNIFEKIGR